MSLSIAKNPWLLPGCGDNCWRDRHDPTDHETWGRHLERLDIHGSPVRTGPLSVDLVREVVTVSGAEIHLTDREWCILAYLAEHIGRWRPVTDIITTAFGPEYVDPKVWQRNNRSGARRRADYHLLRVHLNRLRAKLGPARRLVETRSVSQRPMRRLIEEPAS